MPHRKDLQARKPVRPRRAWRLPEWAGWVAIGLALAEFFRRHALAARPARIGDGWEYLVMACNWARSFTPWVGKDSLVACARETGWSAEMALATFIRHAHTGYDPFHFWLLSLLAAPFAALCRAAGASQFYAFPLLHLAIALGVAWRLIRALGQARAAFLLLIMACSPLIFWSNKAHSEFFVACGVLLAFAVLYRGRTLEAAFWLGLVANQQLTMAPFAYGLAGWWLLRNRPRSWRRALPALAAPLLCPVYTELRYGMPSLINLAGTNDYSAVSLRRALALYIDPDIGLFPNWPLGLALAVAIAACAIIQRKAPGAAAVFTACWCVLLPLAMTVQTNWNSGGTVYISRYALYQIPPIAVWATVLLFRLAPAAVSPKAAVAAALGVCMLLWMPYRRNLAIFHPAQGERYGERTSFAEWVYGRWPGVYDPPPEIFIERTVNSELTTQYFGAGTWAMSNFPCTKLLLVRPPAEMRKMAAFDRPTGCYSEFDTKGVAAAVAAGKIRPTRLGYVNLPPGL